MDGADGRFLTGSCTKSRLVCICFCDINTLFKIPKWSADTSCDCGMRKKKILRIFIHYKHELLEKWNNDTNEKYLNHVSELIPYHLNKCKNELLIISYKLVEKLHLDHWKNPPR